MASVAAAMTGHATAAQRHVQDGQLLYAVQDAALDDLAAFTVNPDGSHAKQIFAQPMECPHWSPDGTQIASCGGPDPDTTTTILTVDTGATRYLPSVAPKNPDLLTPCYVWSSDGAHMACEAFSADDSDSSQNGIFTVRVNDWGDAGRLTTGLDVPGDYSPNSKRLVFGRSFDDEGASPALFRINSNGTGLHRITPADVAPASQGSWSPRGNQILFAGRTDPERRQSLWVVHSDGTGLHPLTIEGIPCGRFDDPASVGCSDPTWSPTGTQIAFRVNTPTHTVLERAKADGSDSALVVDMGFDRGSLDWGTHALATGP